MSLKNINVLIVDDDKEIRDVLHVYLRNEGYHVLEAEDGLQALQLLQQHEVQLIILDVMLPKLDGIAACLQIRERSAIPIIMLSAKVESLDKITGLSTGADDYVTKPFHPVELMARVKAQLRRQNFLSLREEEPSEIHIGDLSIHKKQHLVKVRGAAVSLTPIEFSILELLATNRGQIFSVSKIHECVWKEQTPFFSDNTVMVHIRNIREKIELVPRKPQYIKTVWGVGYKIEK